MIINYLLNFLTKRFSFTQSLLCFCSFALIFFVGMKVIYPQSFYGYSIVEKIVADADEDWDDVEEIEVSSKKQKVLSPFEKIQKLLGYFHAALIHFPIAWLFLLILIDTLTFVSRRNELVKIGYCLMWGTLFSFIPAIITGLIHAMEYAEGSQSLKAAIEHRNIILISLLIFIIAVITRVYSKNNLSVIKGYIYLVLLFVSAFFIIIGAHHGGAMVYGEIPF